MTDHNIELGVDTTEGVPGTEDAPAVDVAGRNIVRVIAGPNSPYSRYLNDCMERLMGDFCRIFQSDPVTFCTMVVGATASQLALLDREKASAFLRATADEIAIDPDEARRGPYADDLNKHPAAIARHKSIAELQQAADAYALAQNAKAEEGLIAALGKMGIEVEIKKPPTN